MKRPGPLSSSSDLPGRSAGAGEPAAAAGAGAEPPSDLGSLLGLPPALAKLVRGLEPMLRPHLARAPQAFAAHVAKASDAELARLAAIVASSDPRAARRIAFHVLAATVVELEGFKPQAIHVGARRNAGDVLAIPYAPPKASDAAQG